MTMSSDPALWEMFRTEVDTHMAVLTDGLLALERDPQHRGQLDTLMRAAHSIKGAAKIVGLPAAVDVAHALEDCFVAARERRLQLNSRLIDALFEGVDLLGRVAHVDTAGDDVAEAVRDVVDKIAAATTASTTTETESVRDAPTTERSVSRDSTMRNVFRPVGGLDASWVLAHHRDVAAVLQQGQSDIRFDLARVDAIDPMGLALLSLANRELAARGRRIRLRLEGVSPQLAQLLEAARFVRHGPSAVEG